MVLTELKKCARRCAICWNVIRTAATATVVAVDDAAVAGITAAAEQMHLWSTGW